MSKETASSLVHPCTTQTSWRAKNVFSCINPGTKGWQRLSSINFFVLGHFKYYSRPVFLNFFSVATHFLPKKNLATHIHCSKEFFKSLYFIHHQINLINNQLSMMHHQMSKLKNNLFITKFNGKITNTFNGNITKFNVFLT